MDGSGWTNVQIIILSKCSDCRSIERFCSWFLFKFPEECRVFESSVGKEDGCF